MRSSRVRKNAVGRVWSGLLLALPWMLLAAGSAAEEGEPKPAPWVLRPETPPPAWKRTAAPAPLHWEAGPVHRFVARPRVVWRVTPETARTGWAGDSLERREIRQTRLRLELERAGEGPELLGWVQHLANTEVALLRPGDSRLDDPGPALADSLLPWPNACVLTVYDLDHALDLNLNNLMELPVRFFASVADPAGAGILLIEPDSTGRPRFVPPQEFTGTVRFEEAILTAIRYPPGKRDPIIDAQLPSLERCRFLARLGIRGSTDCVSCCRIPIQLRRDTKGIFHPGYDRATHRTLLDRLKEDLSLLGSGGNEPLNSEEQAALARAASFFYLTGTGSETRQELLKALGPRGDLAPTRLLLNRLDAYFLLEP